MGSTRKGRSRLQDVLETILIQGPILRNEIADAVNLQFATCSMYVKQLLNAGLVMEITPESGEVGRPASPLMVNPRAGAVIGVFMNNVRVEAALLDLHAKVLGSAVLLNDINAQRETLLEQLDVVIKQALQLAESHGLRVLGIGVALAGLVQTRSGISIEFPECKDWVDVPVTEFVESRHGLPCTILNDVDAAALAEQRFGAGRGIDHFLYLHLGPDLALGIVLNGRIYLGGVASAGEFGHMVVQTDGPLCICGNNGCLHALASDRAITDNYLAGLEHGVWTLLTTGDTITAATVLEAAEKGDRLAYQVISRAAYYLGVGLANMVNLFGPEAIVLGGTFLRNGSSFVRQLDEHLRNRPFLPLAQSMKLILAELDDTSGVVGAGAAALDAFCAKQLCEGLETTEVTP